MNKKAIISVSSKQPSGEEEAIEVVTPGEFYKEGNFYYAIYNETELSGMEGTETTLKISEDVMYLKREGTTNTEMEFRPNTENVNLYNTPYGTLELKTKTKGLQVEMKDDGGDVMVDYSLSISGQPSQNTILNINIKI
ncbi:DUF1934 domain-containing protein [Clostridium omnivorum]|uniref:DUF1934 domain-containing protein n=1 Tax=Clostridium omnivorum TaxID=1604902 RepID=A0ABQ5N2L6_9CLOT|nr:DUF1934 domain-containing protein [Clostridium sp. E14]GLC29394.1 hypothetical protein bsdE14_08040 [Clostridium sp. E14]